MGMAAITPALIVPEGKSLSHLWNPTTSGVSYFPFNEGTGLPTAEIAGGSPITASSNNATWIRKGGNTGLVYRTADSTVTDYGTSTNFLPNPATEDQVTLDVLCEFRITDIGGDGTFVWAKGLPTSDGAAFVIGRANTDKIFAWVRGDSGGGDEGLFATITPGATAPVLPLTHIRIIWDGTKGVGYTFGLFVNDMTTAEDTVIDASSSLNGIENTTDDIMEFGMLTPSGTFGNCNTYEAMIRTGIHTEQVL